MNIIFEVLNISINYLHAIFKDWGIVIVILTFGIKALLTPLTYKQKKVMKKQQILGEKIKDIENKYKGDKKRIEKEKTELSTEMAKNSLGCLITLVQIPIIFSLYRFLSNIDYGTGSFLVPWISNLSLVDSYYIIPVIAAVIQLIPNLRILNADMENSKKTGMTLFQMVFMAIISLVIMVKSPVAIGIYWASSGIFSIIEKLIYNKLSSKLTF